MIYVGGSEIPQPRELTRREAEDRVLNAIRSIHPTFFKHVRSRSSRLVLEFGDSGVLSQPGPIAALYFRLFGDIYINDIEEVLEVIRLRPVYDPNDLVDLVLNVHELTKNIPHLEDWNK
ncbi:MAG: hypothetical protein ABIG71_04255 [Candidatus Uhrbacteria bacterium]